MHLPCAIDDDQYKVYFAGDTGYSQHFNDIRQKFGAIDICLLPIASYHGPNYRAVHMTPEDALMVADELGCKVMIPWGYGTWALGYEHVNEPLRRLAQAVEDINPDFIVKALKMGESLNYAELLEKDRIARN